jgi:hypothetical protein
MRGYVNVSTPESVPSHLARLNAAIDDVAKQPGWSYKRVATEAGFDVMTLHALRKGRTKNPDDRTCRGLDRVLGFKEGQGVQRILAGKSPLKAKVAGEPETDLTITEIEASGLTREQKDVLISVYRAQKAAAEDATMQQLREMEERQKRGA